MKYVSASFNLLLSVVWLGRIRRIIWYSIWICTDLTYLKYWLYRFSIHCRYFAFNGRVDILCRVSVSKVYASVNNNIFIERYICYAGFTLYTSNMYTCKYVYFRKRYIEGHTITCIIQPNRWWKNNFLI